jgi:hypothetical protein
MTPAKFVPGGTIGPAPVAVNPKTEVGFQVASRIGIMAGSCF